MEITRAVIEFGTQAVRHYRDKPAIENETRIPEKCLSLFVASHFISQRHWDAKLEVSYPEMLKQLGITGPEVAPVFGGQRADIAVFQDAKPVAIVELKIIDEGRKFDGVTEDWGKIQRLRQLVSSRSHVSLDGYVGALVCDTTKLAEQTIAGLELALGGVTVERGERIAARDVGWGWLFVGAKLI
ncbi:MAG TPA: hypothetical protein VND19_20275 [Acetobacteraceae bacterium]|nr:hypothetical protein [Acetobacteraceae bacterium]